MHWNLLLEGVSSALVLLWGRADPGSPSLCLTALLWVLHHGAGRGRGRLCGWLCALPAETPVHGCLLALQHPPLQPPAAIPGGGAIEPTRGLIASTWFKAVPGLWEVASAPWCVASPPGEWVLIYIFPSSR